MTDEGRTTGGDDPAGAAEDASKTSAREIDELRDERRPLWARVGIVILAIAVVLFISPLAVKLFVPPINPTQPAPPNHVSLDCQMCHTTSADVPVKGVR